MFSRQQTIAPITIVLLMLALLPPMTAAATPAVAPRFRAYYAQHQGWRTLGPPLTELVEADGWPAQYFEKGRLEDHRASVDDPRWAVMYGRLTAELMARAPEHAVNATSISYAALREAADPVRRRAIPKGFTGGTAAVVDGVFIPYDPQLRAVPGYVVPSRFWSYINQADLFPGGWLHDVGLPMTEALLVETVKHGQPRQILLQAFERTVLTYDPQNPSHWQVERGNIGADALGARQTVGTIELPTPNAQVTLPLHLLARVGQPGEQIDVALHWKQGVVLTRTFTTLRGADGRGLLIATLDWHTESPPPQPAARGALLELHSQHGVVLAQQPLQVLRWDDPDAQHVAVYWLLDDHLQPARRAIPPTVRVGHAALNELLWGPRPGNLAGFRSAIPSPEEILRYPHRSADWGPRVTLRSLVIADGVATADFSPELWAYGGDDMRGAQIRAQITQTLLQFPSVDTVRILIAGQSKNVLQRYVVHPQRSLILRRFTYSPTQ